MARRVRQKLTWQDSDAKYQARGKARVLPYDPAWNEELEQVNHDKVSSVYVSSFHTGCNCHIQSHVGASYRVAER